MCVNCSFKAHKRTCCCLNIELTTLRLCARGSSSSSRDHRSVCARSRVRSPEAMLRTRAQVMQQPPEPTRNTPRCLWRFVAVGECARASEESARVLEHLSRIPLTCRLKTFPQTHTCVRHEERARTDWVSHVDSRGRVSTDLLWVYVHRWTHRREIKHISLDISSSSEVGRRVTRPARASLRSFMFNDRKHGEFCTWSFKLLHSSERAHAHRIKARASWRTEVESNLNIVHYLF